MLDLHRPGSPKGDCDAVAVAEEVAALVRIGLGDRGVTVTVESKGPVQVPIPIDGLKQVLLNLVQNAQDALGAAGNIEIRVESDGRRATLQVTDDGPGIDDSALPQLFDPFFTTKADFSAWAWASSPLTGSPGHTAEGSSRGIGRKALARCSRSRCRWYPGPRSGLATPPIYPQRRRRDRAPPPHRRRRPDVSYVDRRSPAGGRARRRRGSRRSGGHRAAQEFRLRPDSPRPAHARVGRMGSGSSRYSAHGARTHRSS